MLTKLMRRAARLSCSWQIDWPVNVCWWCNVWLYFLFIVFVYFRLLNFSFFHLCCATTYDAEIKLYIMHLCVMYFAWSLSIVSSVDSAYSMLMTCDYFAPPTSREQIIVMGMSVCGWVCVFVREHISGTACVSCEYCPWMWLGPSLAALRCYVLPFLWLWHHVCIEIGDENRAYGQSDSTGTAPKRGVWCLQCCALFGAICFAVLAGDSSR